jgi:hypothetical protein
VSVYAGRRRGAPQRFKRMCRAGGRNTEVLQHARHLFTPSIGGAAPPGGRMRRGAIRAK